MKGAGVAVYGIAMRLPASPLAAAAGVVARGSASRFRRSVRTAASLGPLPVALAATLRGVAGGVSRALRPTLLVRRGGVADVMARFSLLSKAQSVETT